MTTSFPYSNSTSFPTTFAPAVEIALNEQSHPFLQFDGFIDGSWTTFFIVAVASSRLGTLFTVLRLPLITGYMIIGIICGPYLLGLVSKTQIPELSYVTQFALSFIAFSAGSELYLPELRSLFRTILWMSFFLASVTFVLCTLIIYATAQGGLLAWTAPLSNGCIGSISTIAATIMVARSPASAIAVIRELRAKGPVTSTMLGVTVFGDVIVLVLFALSSSVAIAACSTEGNVKPVEFIITLLTLVAAIGIGYAVGAGFVFLLWIKKVPARFTILPIGFFIFVICDWFSVYSLNQWGVSINFDALLICITAGYVVTNRSANRLMFLQMLGSAGSYVFIPFFTLVGVGLNLQVLVQTIGFAFLIWFVRAVCIFIACYAGGTVVKMDRKKKLTVWMTMLAQAGVSLGLAAEVAVKFPVWGPSFQTTIIGVVLINQFLGPILCKYSLKKNEEDGKMTEEDEHEHEHEQAHDADEHLKRQDDDANPLKKPAKKLRKRALIVGIDNVVLALASRLLLSSWDVVLLDEDSGKISLAQSVLEPFVIAADEKSKITTSQAERAEFGGAALQQIGNVVGKVTDKVLGVVEGGLDKLHEYARVEDSANKSSIKQENDNENEHEHENESSMSDNHDVSVDVEPSSGVHRPAYLCRLSASSLNVVDSIASSVRRTLETMSLADTGDFDVAIITATTDEQTKNLGTMLIEDKEIRLTKVLGRLHNPAWAPVFSAHGLLPIFGLSSRVSCLRSVIDSTGGNVSLVSNSENLPQSLANIIETEYDRDATLLTMTQEEQEAYLSSYPPPTSRDFDSSSSLSSSRLVDGGDGSHSLGSLFRFAVPRVSLFGVVPSSLREDYMSSILRAHSDNAGSHAANQESSKREMEAAGNLFMSNQMYKLKRQESKTTAKPD